VEMRGLFLGSIGTGESKKLAYSYLSCGRSETLRVENLQHLRTMGGGCKGLGKVNFIGS